MHGSPLRKQQPGCGSTSTVPKPSPHERPLQVNDSRPRPRPVPCLAGTVCPCHPIQRRHWRLGRELGRQSNCASQPLRLHRHIVTPRSIIWGGHASFICHLFVITSSSRRRQKRPIGSKRFGWYPTLCLTLLALVAQKTFKGASSFNADLSAWKTSTVINMKARRI